MLPRKFPVYTIAVPGDPQLHVRDRFEITPPRTGYSEVGFAPHVDVSFQGSINSIRRHNAEKVSVVECEVKIYKSESSHPTRSLRSSTREPNRL
jgi:hypothetical protein